MKQIKLARTGYILISILFYLSGILCLTVPNISGKTAAMAGGGCSLLAEGLMRHYIVHCTVYLSPGYHSSSQKESPENDRI